MDWSKTGEEVFVTQSDVIDGDDCPARSSVLALAVTCALLVSDVNQRINGRGGSATKYQWISKLNFYTLPLSAWLA